MRRSLCQLTSLLGIHLLFVGLSNMNSHNSLIEKPVSHSLWKWSVLRINQTHFVQVTMKNTESEGKHPLKRVEPALRNFITILRIDIDRLHKHKSNVKKVSPSFCWQINSRRGSAKRLVWAQFLRLTVFLILHERSTVSCCWKQFLLMYRCCPCHSASGSWRIRSAG